MSAVATAPAPPSVPTPGSPKTSFHKNQFRFSSVFFTGLTGLATLLILAFLAIIFGNILMLGWQGFSWRFITAGTEADMFDVNKAGVLPMIVGTTARVILMTIFVIPVGVITAIYLTEYAHVYFYDRIWPRVVALHPHHSWRG
jgi:phosphate transport system permease protein